MNILNSVREVKDMSLIPWIIPVFPEEEGNRRHAAIRTAMDREGLECLIVAGVRGNYGDRAGNFRYISNYAPWFDDEYIAFPRVEKPLLLAWSVPHAEWCRKVSWIKNVEPIGVMSTVPTRKMAYAARIAEYVNSLGCGQSRIGICDFETMPVYVYLGLQKLLPGAEFVDAREVLSRIRMIKSPMELDFMKKAADCADIGFKAMLETAKPGVSETKVWAACEYSMTLAGAMPPSFTLMSAGPSLREKGRGQPYAGTGRTLQKGDIITTEISASYGGYWVQLCAPIVIGHVIPNDLRQMFDVHQEMYELAVAQMRPGITLGSIQAKLQELARSRGCDPSPAWALAHIGLLIRDDIASETVLQPNMTFVNHPYTQYENGAYSNHTIGSTLVITERGCEVLNRTSMEVFLSDT
jgi:Xaa-Pro aminopeptidase